MYNWKGRKQASKQDKRRSLDTDSINKVVDANAFFIPISIHAWMMGVPNGAKQAASAILILASSLIEIFPMFPVGEAGLNAGVHSVCCMHVEGRLLAEISVELWVSGEKS